MFPPGSPFSGPSYGSSVSTVTSTGFGQPSRTVIYNHAPGQPDRAFAFSSPGWNPFGSSVSSSGSGGVSGSSSSTKVEARGDDEVGVESEEVGVDARSMKGEEEADTD